MPRRSKKRSAVFPKAVAPDPLVDSGNPSYRDQARTTAHPTRLCYRVVTRETRSPSSGAPRSSQTKNATVMLVPIAGSVGECIRKLPGQSSLHFQKALDSQLTNCGASAVLCVTAKSEQRCVNRVGLSAFQRLPLFPWKRTGRRPRCKGKIGHLSETSGAAMYTA